MLVNKKNNIILYNKREIEDSFSRMIHYKNVCIEKSDNITFTTLDRSPAEEVEEEKYVLSKNTILSKLQQSREYNQKAQNVIVKRMRSKKKKMFKYDPIRIKPRGGYYSSIVDLIFIYFIFGLYYFYWERMLSIRNYYNLDIYVLSILFFLLCEYVKECRARGRINFVLFACKNIIFL